MKNVVLEVRLSSVDEVKEFVNITTRIEGEVDVLSGRYVVDAKSIMALFSVDLNRPLKVVFLGGEEDAQQFRALADGKFIMAKI